MSRVIFLAEALETFRWYEEQRRGLGTIFRAELKEAIKRIRDAPLAYPPQYRDLRRVLVERFPYAVFFRVMTIVVVGVVHGRRHPREWGRRT